MLERASPARSAVAASVGAVLVSPRIARAASRSSRNPLKPGDPVVDEPDGQTTEQHHQHRDERDDRAHHGEAAARERDLAKS
jgi:hypothetical protein